ncbi:baseplate J/gp47 family protein [Rhodoplanes sp. TEM]|uniref:Baseplate J/gp47 family protein n=1 Tax=Rhodoplanes tepidamans TaxID=200616 RepID=A0ABT5JCE5_RHOTP|nr:MULTISPECIES: baseplate J/gp47 family protein [Rhodoplanes]MDC7787365.1 baseplate J/gp47 family protein [Rhodoplanes tepidamans]MDC7984753.1 baseplate J/gp47 family protein [Rhodoplanes sp. TEM]MDQ0358276.1 phage-related baseplate assembly protein [Rhodoplanes tepidamans]
MTDYTADTLDLSRIGAPTLTAIDFEATLRARLLDFKTRWDAARAANPSLPVFDVIDAAGDPVTQFDAGVVLAQEFAFGEINVLQAINEHANALRLGTAVGADLDHLAITYKATQRLVLSGAAGGADAVAESDDEYRARAQLSDEARPLFGLTPGGYQWRVRKLYGDRVKHVRALRRTGGRIDLIVLAREGDGTAPETLIGDLQGAFDGEAGSQSTDIVTVWPARIVATAARVKLWVPRGPDPAVAVAAAATAIAALAAERHKIGETLHAQAVGAVAKSGAVRKVDVLEPAADVAGGEDGAPFVSSITVSWGIDA